jgi:NDP-sugar pyrophosphorylase family protein/aminoglycoside phosphotransferase (APT) family kinase protein
MDKPVNVFILAAGFGERLQPITSHIPKPLIPILGRPVLLSVLEKVSSLPFNKIGINLYHKKEMIQDWVKQCPFGGKISLFPEEQTLGTGGALKNAEDFLSKKTILVHNSDILSDMDLQRLLEHHLASGSLVTLAVHDHKKFNNVFVDKKGFLQDVGDVPAPARMNRQRTAFTGIAVYEPEFLKFLPEGPSSVVDAWLKAVSEGHTIGTFDVTGCYWSDIGTPDAYARAVFDALKTDGETLYIHPSVKGCGNAEMQGYVVMEEGCDAEALHATPLLRNCILLPDCRAGAIQVQPHRVAPALENCIVGPDFKLDLNEAAISETPDEEERQMIGTGGSDRKYYRVRMGRRSAVLMQCRGDDPDFTRQMEYTHFFLKYSVPVPELLETDINQKKAVFEDAGDTSLYNWLKCPRKEREVEDVYRKIIDALGTIHTVATDHVAECPSLKNRIFDYEYFRWETDYFFERFVEGVRNIRAENIPGAGEELHLLALKADSFPKTIIHRDFQSQNIMLMADAELRIIDYQGARMGPSAYDVASLLWDPYHRLEDGMRERLVNYYIGKIEDKFDAGYFRETIAVCRLQRHMQALGAYGFLSSVKGKRYFLKYASEGLRLLKEDISLFRVEYPELYKLITGL